MSPRTNAMRLITSGPATIRSRQGSSAKSKATGRSPAASSPRITHDPMQPNAPVTSVVMRRIIVALCADGTRADPARSNPVGTRRRGRSPGRGDPPEALRGFPWPIRGSSEFQPPALGTRVLPNARQVEPALRRKTKVSRWDHRDDQSLGPAVAAPGGDLVNLGSVS